MKICLFFVYTRSIILNIFISTLIKMSDEEKNDIKFEWMVISLLNAYRASVQHMREKNC